MLVHNRLNSLIAALRSVVGVFVAVSLFSIGLFVPVSAQPTAEVGLTTVLGNHFPAVESTLQHGASLVQGENTIPLDGVEDETVLVRFTTFGTDGLSLTSRGVPFLQSHSRVPVVSATTFLRAKEGKVVISASQPADVKIDVLAKFSAEENSVGSMRLLENPVAVVDTNERVGVDSLQGESEIYVNGHAAPEGTRFALVTINSEMQSAGILELGGQRLQLPVGKRATTTLALVTGEKITYSATGNGSLQIHVVGYIVSSAATSAESDGRSATTAGAIYGFTKRQAKTISLASGDEGVSVLAKQPGAAVFGFVAAKTDGSVSGTVGGDFDVEGRATGIAVPNGTDGNPGEIVVLASEDPRLHSTVKATVEILPLAFIQSEGDESAPLEIRIETPKDDFVRVRHAIMEVSGHFTSSEAVEKIAISVNGRELSEEAFIRLEDEGGYWKHMIAPSESGEVTIDVTMTTVNGRTATARWTGNVQLPDEDEIVLSPLTQILSDEEMSAMKSIGGVLFESRTKPSYEIGKIIVGGSSEQAPDGVLGQVYQIIHVDGKWYTLVRPATLGNVILQGKAKVIIGRNQDGAISALLLNEDGSVVSADPPVAARSGFGQSTAVTSLPISLFSLGDDTSSINDLLDRKESLFDESCEESFEYPDSNAGAESEESENSGNEKANGKSKVFLVQTSGSVKASFKCSYKGDLIIDFESWFVPQRWQSWTINAISPLAKTYKWWNDETLLEDEDVTLLEQFVELVYALPSGQWKLQVEVAAALDVDSQFSLGAKGEIALNPERFKIPINLPTMRFMIGPVPVVISGDISIAPLVKAGFEGKAVINPKAKLNLRSGLSISPEKGIEPILETPFERSANVEGSINVNAELGVTAQPSLSLYGLLHLGLSVNPRLRLDAGANLQYDEKGKLDLLDAKSWEAMESESSFEINVELRNLAGISYEASLGYDLHNLINNSTILNLLEEAGVSLKANLLGPWKSDEQELINKLIFEYHYPKKIQDFDFNNARWIVSSTSALGGHSGRSVQMNQGRYRAPVYQWAGRPASCPQPLPEFDDYYSDHPEDSGLYSDFKLIPEGKIQHGITEPQYYDFDGDGHLDALIPVYLDDICSDTGSVKWTAWRYDRVKQKAKQAISLPFGDHLPEQKVATECSQSIDAIEFRRAGTDASRVEVVFTRRANIAPCDKPETSRQIKLTYSKDAGYFH